MARPRKDPHPVWRRDTAKWYVADGRALVPIRPPVTVAGEVGRAAAALAVARYVVAKAAAATAPVRTDRDLAEVSIAEVLDRYLERRQSGKKACARLNEAEQRVAKLVAFFKEQPIAFLNKESCEAFAEFCGSPSYARRCLADLQAALTEARKAALFRTPVLVTLPPPPAPREDHLTFEEAVALVKVCLRRRDGQHRPIWRHVARFVIVAIATCSRSSRVYEASYEPEDGRPWVDIEEGVLYRQAEGDVRTKKRAPEVDLSPRLVAAMRRWSTDRVVGGKPVRGDRYVVQWRGRAANPKKAFEAAVEAAVVAARADDLKAVAEGRKPRKLFLRRDGKTPKVIVRHTLRHTGVTWLAETPGVSVEDVCSYAGMTRAMFDTVYSHAHRARSRNIVAAQSRKARKGITTNTQDH